MRRFSLAFILSVAIHAFIVGTVVFLLRQLDQESMEVLIPVDTTLLELAVEAPVKITEATVAPTPAPAPFSLESTQNPVEAERQDAVNEEIKDPPIKPVDLVEPLPVVPRIQQPVDAVQEDAQSSLTVAPIESLYETHEPQVQAIPVIETHQEPPFSVATATAEIFLNDRSLPGEVPKESQAVAEESYVSLAKSTASCAGHENTAPIPKHPIRPQYPSRSRRRGHEGEVQLRIEVSAEGRVKNVTVLHSSGHQELDEAAQQAAWITPFHPAQSAGVPVEGSVLQPLSFRLKNRVRSP